MLTAVGQRSGAELSDQPFEWLETLLARGVCWIRPLAFAAIPALGDR
jgi:hypothetical protein